MNTGFSTTRPATEKANVKTAIEESVDILCYGKSAANALIEIGLALSNPHTPEAHRALLAKRDQIEYELRSYAARWKEASRAADDNDKRRAAWGIFRRES